LQNTTAASRLLFDDLEAVMNLELLQLFSEVVDSGSFAAVARQRLLDPSSVSRMVATLEEELGIRLFQRTTRRLSLTESGAAYLARIQPLLEELQRAADEARQLSARPSGTLRLTASVTFGQLRLLPLLPEFRRRYPDVQLECHLTDTNLDLVSERIDLAIRLAPQVQGDLVVTKLHDTRYRVVASPGYLQLYGRPLSPEQLSEHACLQFLHPDCRSLWQFRRGNETVLSVPVDGAVVISSALALRECALLDMGPALLPDWLVAQALADGRLLDLFPEYDCASSSFNTHAWLLYPSRAYLPAKVRVMIDFLKEHLASGVADRK
jgi:DNA-binding transcriptional LysR family regulator